MAAENRQLRASHAEVAKEMVRVLERQNNLWDRVESGFDRSQSQIDRTGEDMRRDMREYVAELRINIRDVQRENSEASDRLRARIDSLTGAATH